MLHPNLNSNLALKGAERQIFGRLTTKVAAHLEQVIAFGSEPKRCRRGTTSSAADYRAPERGASRAALTSSPTTLPALPTRAAATRVTTPVPQATSRTRVPGCTLARSISFGADEANMLGRDAARSSRRRSRRPAASALSPGPSRVVRSRVSPRHRSLRSPVRCSEDLCALSA